MKNVHEIEIKVDKKWQDALDKAFKKKQKDLQIDGFRKGNVPKDIYLKRFGIESLYMSAIDMVVNEALQMALKDQKDLEPIVEPKVDVKNVSDKEIEFKFTIITKPEITLGEYKKLGVKRQKAKVSAEEIDSKVKEMQNQMADLVNKEEGAKIAQGDIAIIDFVGYVDNEKLEGGSAENYSLEIGSHSFIPGFEEGLIDHKSDDKLTLNLKFPEDYTESLKGKDVRFEITIHEIKTRVVPEVNEEFFKDLGYEDVKTMDELKKVIKEEILAQRDEDLEDKFLEECLEKASLNMKAEINDEIIDEEIHRMMDQYEHQLQMQGMDLEKYYQITGQDHESLHKLMKPEAEKRVKYRFLIEEVAKKEKVEFTEKEVKDKAKEMAENYGMSVDELIKSYGSLDIVKYDMTVRRALEIIKETNE